MFQINIEDVSTTYNGEDGCACGCGGTYATLVSGYRSGYFQQANPRTAKRRVNKVNKALAAGDPNVTVMDFGSEAMFSLTTGEDRVTRVYVDIEEAA